jgi:hypothetical protein
MSTPGNAEIVPDKGCGKEGQEMKRHLDRRCQIEEALRAIDHNAYMQAVNSSPSVVYGLGREHGLVSDSEHAQARRAYGIDWNRAGD